MFFTLVIVWLVYALCLIQIVSGVALYGTDGNVASKITQVVPTLSTFITALKIHPMLSYAHRADPTHPLSRVEGQYLLLISDIVGMWVLCVIV
ncbi:hypothetical protein DFH09DRAFT_1338097 [Mycena vulgaris]|nr:hypothetical protein DFH09DRAFT_1338097 [Mycena vulgaris]